MKLAFSEPTQLDDVLRSFADEARRYRNATETLRALVAREPMSHGGRVRWLIAEAARRSYEAELGWLECVHRMLAPVSLPSARRAGPLPLRRNPSAPAERRDAVA